MAEHADLQDWLTYLEHQHDQPIQLGLNRVQEVAKLLGLLALSAKVVTVAGTNGKGSTVATLEAIYVEAGYQVGSYTSPHLLRFNERIRINQQEISDEALCKAFTVVEKGRKSIHLTYFEMATLAALWHFQQHNLDVIILEVGLGGRLDATNIISSDAAIITTIDYDHQEFLGSDKESIAYEKAGILRENKPFIFADYNPPASIMRVGESLNAPGYFLGKQYDYQEQEGLISLSFQEKKFQYPVSSLHANSIGAALILSFLWQTYLPIEDTQRLMAIKKVTLPGRLQWVDEPLPTLFDVAHNPQSAARLAKYLHTYPRKGAVHAVFSALKDKDLSGLIMPLLPIVDHWYPALLSGKRATAWEQLRDAFNLCNIDPICYNGPLSAYQAACKSAQQEDVILVYGSFVTVSELMQNLGVVDKP